MTSARPQRAVPDSRWDECSLLSDRPGMTWWAAVGCALVLTAIGVFVDLERLNQLGVAFQACYLLGCLLAVAVVRRKELFAPMVQPPLILAVALPGVVLATGSLPTEGIATTALTIGTPLINCCPTMAITTGLALALGTFRLITQRRRRNNYP